MSDYIKRDDAYQAVADNNYSDSITLARYDAILESIGNIPPADVRENVHGHWIHRKNWGERYVCSNCSKEMTESQIGAFCKECGAIMDGGDER